jgi:hypothetical protein
MREQKAAAKAAHEAQWKKRDLIPLFFL